MTGERTSVVEYGARRFIVIAAVMVAALMQTLDSTIVNVALPSMQGNLGASQDEATWVITGFIISNVIIIPMTPWLCARLGRKEYFALSIAGFTIASALCGWAPSFELLVFFRVLQGAFGGGLLAVAQPILRDTLPHEQLGLSQGLFAIGAICGPALGPWIGGILTDELSWRWVFYVNVAPGIVATLLIWFFLRNPQQPQRLSADGIGIALLAIGIGSFQFVLEEGERNDWFDSTMITTFSILSLVAMVAFVLYELLGTKTPIINLRLLTKRAVGIGSIVALALGIPMFGIVLILPQYVSNVLGFTASMSGDLLLIRAAPIALATPLVGILIQRGVVDSRLMLAAGTFITGVGSVWLSLTTTAGTPFSAMIAPLIVQGIGASMLFVPLLITVMGSVSGHDSSMASAFVNLFFQLGGSIASALLVTLFDRRSAMHLDGIAGTATNASAPIASALHVAGTHAHEAIVALAMTVQLQANVMGFSDVFLVIGAASLAVIPLVLAMPKPTNTHVEIELA